MNAQKLTLENALQENAQLVMEKIQQEIIAFNALQIAKYAKLIMQNVTQINANLAIWLMLLQECVTLVQQIVLLALLQVNAQMLDVRKVMD